jgi:hypothetical protein
VLGAGGAGIRQLFDRGSLVAGKRGQSGPPGNLHAAKHPWRSFWRRRALRPADRWILPVLEGYALALSSDKPGMTETETLMAQNAQTARGAVMLILAEAARSGFTRQVEGTWDLAPGAKELAKFLTAERGALQAIGLDRRTRPTQTLQGYLETSYGCDHTPASQAVIEPDGKA